MDSMAKKSGTLAEKLHLAPRRKYLFNAHSHSTVSDGQLSPREIADLAERQKMLFSITDHLRIDAYDAVQSDRLIPGVEVKVEEGGVDFLVYADTPTRLEEFFRHVVVPRNPGNTMYGPTRLRVHQLLGEAFDRNLHVVLPHFGTPEGLSALNENAQEEVAKYPVFVELNGRVGRAMNRQAKHFAREHHLPVIAAGDSHLKDQYTTTYTGLKLPAETPPTADAVFAAIRSRRVQFLLQHASWLDTLRTGTQSIGSMLARRDGLLSFLYNTLRNCLSRQGIHPNTAATSSAAPPGETPGRAGEGGGGGS